AGAGPRLYGRQARTRSIRGDRVPGTDGPRLPRLLPVTPGSGGGQSLGGRTGGRRPPLLRTKNHHGDLLRRSLPAPGSDGSRPDSPSHGYRTARRLLTAVGSASAAAGSR